MCESDVLRHDVDEQQQAGLPRSIGFLITSLMVVASCGGGNDRPSDAEWQATWQQKRDEFPDAETLLAGGTEFCDALIGDLRVGLPDLRPAPTEALDDAVQAWINHAETIAFECPHDASLLDDALKVLAVFEAEIDAGLIADSQG